MHVEQNFGGRPHRKYWTMRASETTMMKKAWFQGFYKTCTLRWAVRKGQGV